MHEPDPASRVAPVHVAPATAFGENAGPHALQILKTEHWSLLSSRSLGYTEAMSRASIFVGAHRLRRRSRARRAGDGLR